MEIPADQYASWALEVNNALRNDSEKITFSEARTIVQGASEAFRQCIFELFIIFDMDAETWFSDTTRRHWAEQIKSAYAQWVKDKA